VAEALGRFTEVVTADGLNHWSGAGIRHDASPIRRGLRVMRATTFVDQLYTSVAAEPYANGFPTRRGAQA
jgi:hypothetical protein